MEYLLDCSGWLALCHIAIARFWYLYFFKLCNRSKCCASKKHKHFKTKYYGYRISYTNLAFCWSFRNRLRLSRSDPKKKQKFLECRNGSADKKRGNKKTKTKLFLSKLQNQNQIIQETKEHSKFSKKIFLCCLNQTNY